MNATDEKSKTYYIPADSYEEWIKNLEKAGLSYVWHEHKAGIGQRKKNKWTKQWHCYRYRSYSSVADRDPNKKSWLAQKESKK
ncbi:17249_t:CDS:2, partial [Cetraspora pellucida]